MLQGGTCLLTDYDPVRKLEAVERCLRRHYRGEGDNPALDYIVSLRERGRHVAFVELTEADRNFKRFRERLADFAAFFEKANIERVNAWGSRASNSDGFSARLVERQGMLICEMRKGKDSFAVTLKPHMWMLREPWPDLS